MTLGLVTNKPSCVLEVTIFARAIRTNSVVPRVFAYVRVEGTSRAPATYALAAVLSVTVFHKFWADLRMSIRAVLYVVTPTVSVIWTDHLGFLDVSGIGVGFLAFGCFSSNIPLDIKHYIIVNGRKW